MERKDEPFQGQVIGAEGSLLKVRCAEYWTEEFLVERLISPCGMGVVGVGEWDPAAITCPRSHC